MSTIDGRCPADRGPQTPTASALPLGVEVLVSQVGSGEVDVTPGNDQHMLAVGHHGLTMYRKALVEVKRARSATRVCLPRARER
jgi:hypothetical protein